MLLYEFDRQCTYNVTFRRVHESLLLWKSIIYFCVCVCVCTSPCACACARIVLLTQHETRMRRILLSSVWPLWHHHIFGHYLTNGMIFERKKLLNVKCVFWFSLQLLSITFLILRRIQRRYCHKCENVFMSSTRYYCQRLKKLEFSPLDFRKKT
jgi:hypothetical protein